MLDSDSFVQEWNELVPSLSIALTACQDQLTAVKAFVEVTLPDAGYEDGVRFIETILDPIIDDLTIESFRKDLTYLLKTLTKEGEKLQNEPEKFDKVYVFNTAMEILKKQLGYDSSCGPVCHDLAYGTIPLISECLYAFAVVNQSDKELFKDNEFELLSVFGKITSVAFARRKAIDFRSHLHHYLLSRK